MPSEMDDGVETELLEEADEDDELAGPPDDSELEDELEDDLEADALDDELVGDVDVDVDVEEEDEEEVDLVAVPPEPGAESEDTATDDDDEELDDDDVEASLDVILKERLVVTEEEDDEEDEEDVADVEDRVDGTTRVLPKQPGEFVCQSCFLVKSETQLADAKRMLCRDCV